MPAPPISLMPICAGRAADAIRSASARGSSSGALPAIDLDHDGLEVGHLLEGEAAADASDAAVLACPAAKRQMRLPVVRRLVDVHPTHLESVGKAQGAREVAGIDGSEQAIRRVVGHCQRLLFVAE